jgi:hypothetical protein
LAITSTGLTISNLSRTRRAIWQTQKSFFSAIVALSSRLRGLFGAFFELHPVPYYLILPDLTGIGTLDGSHLEQQSAERWSAAFLQEYAPIMERCLNTPGTADPSQTSSHRP